MITRRTYTGTLPAPRLPLTAMVPPALLPYLWMLCGAAAFAVMSVLTAALKDQLDWQWIAISRAGLAMIFAASMAVAARAKLVFLRPRKLWMRSLAGSVSLVCGFYAMTHYRISEVITLTNMFPLWVAVLSLPLLGEWPALDVWPAIAIGLVGVLLIQSEPVTGDYGAICAALLSSFTSAVALIGLHQVRELDPRSVVAHFSGVALAVCVAALFVFPHERPLVLSTSVVLLLLGIGLCATVGQLFFDEGICGGAACAGFRRGLNQSKNHAHGEQLGMARERHYLH